MKKQNLFNLASAVAIIILSANCIFAQNNDYISALNGKNIVFKTGNTERMQITSDGLIGIGGVPTEKLHIFGNLKVSGSISTNEFNVTGATSFDSLHVTNKIKIGNSITIGSQTIPGADQISANSGQIDFIKTNLHIYSDNEEYCPKIRLEYSYTGTPMNGCGIGTSIWDIKSAGNNHLFFETPSLSVPVMVLTENGVGINNDGVIITGYDAGARLRLDVTGDGRFKDATGNNYIRLGYNGGNSIIDNFGTGNLLINYYSGKEVHIGTGTDKADVHMGKDLYVCGTIRSKEWVVETAWCDFKLNPDFKRMTADEKLFYIHTYGHLPEIDPGLEIETNGLKVAKNIRGMIWNIEDNTLDIIALQKDNENLKKENEELSKRIEVLEKKMDSK